MATDRDLVLAASDDAFKTEVSRTTTIFYECMAGAGNDQDHAECRRLYEQGMNNCKQIRQTTIEVVNKFFPA